MNNRISILNSFNHCTFVETGSLFGDGIQMVLDCGLKKIKSVELDSSYYNHCVNRFKDNSNVFLYLGDSCDFLWEMIKDEKNQIIFWLDGHYSGGNTAFGKFEFPIMEELETISKHTIKNHIILIDDIRCWENTHYKLEDVFTKIKSINPKYKIDRINGAIEKDIIFAHVES